MVENIFVLGHRPSFPPVGAPFIDNLLAVRQPVSFFVCDVHIALLPHEHDRWAFDITGIRYVVGLNLECGGVRLDT
ncbi:hypothetical protein D3C84_405770 [compost metagenome]